MKKLSAFDLYLEFLVVVKDGNIEIPFCGLCGNSGTVDTVNKAKHNNKYIGVVAYCICPNGRAKKTKQSTSIIYTEADDIYTKKI
jgi:hypothetical protein